jgi:hypothetical protein
MFLNQWRGARSGEISFHVSPILSIIKSEKKKKNGNQGVIVCDTESWNKAVPLKNST